MENYMKKKILSVLLLMSMLLCAGCNSNTNENVTPTATVSPTQMAEGSGTGDSNAGGENQEQEDKKEYTDPTWAENSIFYEIFVRSFCDSDGDGIGDFMGVASKVDYLKDLGVDAIWLMPIMETTTYHGYDVVDYYDVNPEYGTMEEFDEMLKVLHDNDIKVIIDFVVNHTSSSNEWFIEALNDANSKYRDYYFIYEEFPQGMSNIRKNMATGLYFYGNYDGIMPDLNYANQSVRDDVKEVAGFWLDKGVDGFRLDGSKEIDADGEITHGWWKEFTNYVSEKNPAAFVVGENWNNSAKTIAPFYADMNSSFNFPFATAIEDMANGAVRDYVTELNEARKLYQETADSQGSANKYMIDSTMLTNHDMNRVAYRVEDIKGQKLAAALFMTLPGTPFIYYGDEIGQLGGGTDPMKREAFDWYKSGSGEGQVNNKTAIGADAKFIIPDDGISYEEEKDVEDSIFNYCKKLIKIRKDNPVMFAGDYKTFGRSEEMYAYTISGAEDGSTIVVVHNIAGAAKDVTVNVAGEELLTGKEINAGDKVNVGEGGTIIIKYNSSDAPLLSEEFIYQEAEKYKVTFNVTLPENTPEDENIYIVGSFNDWNECDDDYILIRTSKTTATITVEQEANKTIEYKFTRGMWPKREQNKDGADLIGPEQAQNRRCQFDKDGKVEEVVIELWSDLK